MDYVPLKGNGCASPFERMSKSLAYRICLNKQCNSFPPNMPTSQTIKCALHSVTFSSLTG
jgi:hypothetical protein